jgi:hypothetical protein
MAIAVNYNNTIIDSSLMERIGSRDLEIAIKHKGSNPI